MSWLCKSSVMCQLSFTHFSGPDARRTYWATYWELQHNQPAHTMPASCRDTLGRCIMHTHGSTHIEWLCKSSVMCQLSFTHFSGPDARRTYWSRNCSRTSQHMRE
jgi:hypothetical protein